MEVQTLSPECMRVLVENEVCAEFGASDVIALYDCDGGKLFHVHKGIHVIDLRTMLRMRRDRFDAGVAEGKRQAFASLRALIGVDDAIRDATSPITD